MIKFPKIEGFIMNFIKSILLFTPLLAISSSDIYDIKVKTIDNEEI